MTYPTKAIYDVYAKVIAEKISRADFATWMNETLLDCGYSNIPDWAVNEAFHIYDASVAKIDYLEKEVFWVWITDVMDELEELNELV